MPCSRHSAFTLRSPGAQRVLVQGQGLKCILKMARLGRIIWLTLLPLPGEVYILVRVKTQAK